MPVRVLQELHLKNLFALAHIFLAKLDHIFAFTQNQYPVIKYI